MRRTTTNRGLAAVAVLALAGCGGGDGGSDRGNGAGGTPPEEAAFTGFVGEVLSTPANGEPAPVNDRRLRFDDRGNPDAYDDVLQ